jgi:hypothetical protein
MRGRLISEAAEGALDERHPPLRRLPAFAKRVDG